MTELSPEARRLLGLARRGDDPRESDRARMNHRMAQRLALAAGAATAALGTTKVAAGTAALSTLLGKGILTGVVVTVTAFGAWRATEFVVSRREPTQSISVKSPSGPTRSTSRLRDKRDPFNNATAPDPSLTPMQPSATDPNQPQSSATTQSPRSSVEAVEMPGLPSKRESNAASPSALPQAVAVTQSRPSSRAPMSAARLDAPENGSRSAEGTTSGAAARLDTQRLDTQQLDAQQDPLSAESAALRAVQHAMNAGDATQALRLLDEQDAAYGGGALAPERAAARIVTLCKLARVTEAQRLAQRFERRFAKSPLLARVRNACAPSPGPNTSNSKNLRP